MPDIAKPVADAFTDLMDLVSHGGDISAQQLMSARDSIIATLRSRSSNDAQRNRKNLQNFLVTHVVVQGFARPEAREYSTQLIEELGDAVVYNNGKAVPFILH
jgi:hypothetical protein